MLYEVITHYAISSPVPPNIRDQLQVNHAGSPDAGPGEGDLWGYGLVFPHDVV